MTSIRTDAAHIFNAAITLLTDMQERGQVKGDPYRAARLDGLVKLAAYGLKHAEQVWIDLSLDDFLLLEAELVKQPG